MGRAKWVAGRGGVGGKAVVEVRQRAKLSEQGWNALSRMNAIHPASYNTSKLKIKYDRRKPLKQALDSGCEMPS